MRLSGPRSKANEAFQKRMRETGVKDHVPTKNKVRLGDGEHVNPGLHLFQEGKNQGRGFIDARQEQLPATLCR